MHTNIGSRLNDLIVKLNKNPAFINRFIVKNSISDFISKNGTWAKPWRTTDLRQALLKVCQIQDTDPEITKVSKIINKSNTTDLNTNTAVNPSPMKDEQCTITRRTLSQLISRNDFADLSVNARFANIVESTDRYLNHQELPNIIDNVDLNNSSCVTNFYKKSNATIIWKQPTNTSMTDYFDRDYDFVENVNIDKYIKDPPPYNPPDYKFSRAISYPCVLCGEYFKGGTAIVNHYNKCLITSHNPTKKSTFCHAVLGNKASLKAHTLSCNNLGGFWAALN
ncbi:hypothetical protein HZS_2798 [Henneguya salminicola]|nr:hypothetical protein HZS_2798 [Henneguya salminicola]